MTTDGIYLYIIVSACNGGMYKIGTGEGGSIAGKVYKYAAVSK
jgi:other hect domain ubiquitin protein ligase E3